MEFRILGPLEARTREDSVALGGPRQRALLALLLLHPNEPLPSERLIDELWDGRPPATAAKVVQNGISGLRKVLERDRILTRGSAYELRVATEELDAWQFEHLVGRGRDALGTGDAARASALLREADALWRGAALVDFRYEGFARAHSFRLEELRFAAIEDRVDAELALGRHADLAAELTLLVDRQPLRERLRGQLMLALYRCGRQAEALAAYRDARRALVEELGIEPGPELQRLERDLLAQSPELDLAQRPAAPTAALDVRKRVTSLVLSMRAAGGSDPEAAGRVLARAADAAARVIERYEATVEAQGDAVVAVFGLPALHEDDVLRALRAAAELQQALAGQELELRIGIDSTEVVVADAVRLPTSGARSLAERAQPGEILIAPAAARLAPAVVVEPAGDAQRVVSVPAGAAAIPRRLDAPLVGREAELQQLLVTYERTVRERTCHLFTILGPAGIGKTRLATELQAAVERSGTVVVARCPPYGDPRQPLTQIVRGLVGDDAPAAIERALRGHPDAATIAAHISTSGAEMQWAVRKLLEAFAAVQPLVVVVDDLHWAEPPFVDLVEHVAELALGAPILLVVLARPELRESRPTFAGGKLNATALLLEPLDDDTAGALIHDLLGRAQLEPPVERAIVAAGAGNPLFLEQILSNLIDEGVLRRDRGRWVADGDVGTHALPPTIQSLLAARLDRLEPLELRVLQTAAIAGPQFSRETVEQLTGLERPQVGAALDALVRKDLVRPAPAAVAGEEGFRFRHILIREAAYESLPKAVRAELHERFAERAGDDALVGHHLAEAHDYRVELGLDGADALAARAAAHLAAAARKAAEGEDAHAVVALLDRAADLRPDEVRFLPLLGESLYATGADGEWAIDRALAAGDETLEWEARLARLRMHLYLDDPAAIRTESLLAVEAFERRGDERGLARAWALAAQAPWFEGRVEEAARAARRSIDHARRAGDALTEQRNIRTLAGTIVFGPTPVDEGIAELHALHGEARGAPLTTALLFGAEAALEAMSQRFDRARELVGRHRAIVDDVGLRSSLLVFSQIDALVETLAGDPEAVVAAAEAGLEIAESLGVTPAAAECFAVIATALVQLGRTDEAFAAAERAEQLSESWDAADNIRWRTAKAAALGARGDAAAAEALAREAVARAEATDFVWLRADALVTLAAASGDAGAREEAIGLYERKGNAASSARAR